jgi:RimJ/RimL family protein N-acetyltransferase
MPQSPTLQTTRLTLRPPDRDDLPALIEIFTDPEVCRYLGDGRPRTREQIEQGFGNGLKCWNKRGFGPFIILESGRVIGDCLVIPIVRSGTDASDFDQRGPEIEIGYRLAHDQWGRGYATEAAARVLEWSLGPADAGPALRRIIAVTYPQNTASRRVLQKIGMRLIGETDDYYNVTTVLYESARPAGAVPTSGS